LEVLREEIDAGHDTDVESFLLAKERMRGLWDDFEPSWDAEFRKICTRFFGMGARIVEGAGHEEQGRIRFV
jgi:hypothetical protein